MYVQLQQLIGLTQKFQFTFKFSQFSNKYLWMVRKNDQIFRTINSQFPNLGMIVYVYNF